MTMTELMKRCQDALDAFDNGDISEDLPPNAGRLVLKTCGSIRTLSDFACGEAIEDEIDAGKEDL